MSSLDEIRIQPYDSPLGEMLLGVWRERLCLCDWIDCKDYDKIQSRLEQNLGAKYIKAESKLLKKTKRQLDAYFERKLEVFDIPLHFVGTVFEQKVWTELCTIPYGHSISYTDLACRVSSAKALRAVAQANAKNIIPIIVPCHRVLMRGKSDIGGFSSGVDRKHYLLCLEQGLEEERLPLFSPISHQF